MNKSNVVQRVILFIISIPVIALSIFFLPYQKHLFINAVSIIISLLATYELHAMLDKKGYKVDKRFVPFLALPMPVLSYFLVRFNLDVDLLLVVFAAQVILILLFSISTKVSDSDFNNNIKFITGSIFMILYPGLFVSYIIRLSEFPSASLLICFYIIIVFMNDSAAWLFGVLGGKGNRGYIKVSKNKSIMGFIGGTFSTFLFFKIATILIPELHNLSLLSYILISLVLSILIISGDLVESALKRSSNIKDSGSIIMGRGGLLDSIDSLLITAPLFYYIIKYAMVL